MHPFTLREITLKGGPHDGAATLASHFMAVHAGEVYMQGGGEPQEFEHVKSALESLPINQFQMELTLCIFNPVYASYVEPWLPKWRWRMWQSALALGFYDGSAEQ